MKRQLSQLEALEFDVLVIGGGVVGACAAWDAALRGLKVALIEREDFASAASSNSLKIIHGGLRYLQHLDLRRMRESIHERSVWLRIAPHLVEPLPVLVPTYRRMLQRKSVLRAALAVNDAVSWDRNRDLQPDREIPPGSVLSRTECLDLVPEFESEDITGAVIFHDAQMYNSERLVLEVVLAAAEAGAVVVNHVEFEAPIRRGHHLVGATVRDRLGGGRLEVRTKFVVNTSGHRAAGVVERLSGRAGSASAYHSLAINLGLPGRGHRVAFAIRGAASDPESKIGPGARQFFFAPWRGCLLIGTGHYPYQGDPSKFDLPSDDLARFIGEVSAAWPGPAIDPDDVTFAHSGLIPAPAAPSKGKVSFLRRHLIIDHGDLGVPNALTAITGKYTTGRRTAEEAIDLAIDRLGIPSRACRTGTTPLPGAIQGSLRDLMAEAGRKYGGQVTADVLEHLVRTYGGSYEKVLSYRHEAPDWNQRPVESEPVIKTQWIHAVREELAMCPADLVMRRTELGARGLATDEVLRLAAQTLETERSSAG